jgi:hypothetical protein
LSNSIYRWWRHGARIGYPTLYQETTKKRPFDLLFKREMQKDKAYAENVFACPFAFNLDRIKQAKPIQNKVYNVSFWASETHSDRSKAFELLKGRYDCDTNGTSKGHSFKTYSRRGNHYFEELKRCKVILNIRGNGWDTLRYWEAPALQAFMLSQALDIVIPNPFIDGEHMAYFKKDFSDFHEKIEYYLDNEVLREQIATAGFKHLSKFHTDIARAEYIIEEIKKL